MRAGSTTVTGTLRQAVEKSGETRQEIAAAIGVNPSVLSRFVVEGKDLRGDTIDKLARHLGFALVPVKGKNRKGA